MKKMISFLIITAITVSMMTMALVNVSAATDSTRIYFQYPKDEGKAFVDINANGNHGHGNLPDAWTYTSKDADYVSVTFDEATYVEEDIDNITILDKDENTFAVYSGNQLAGKTVCVPGDKVTVKVTTTKIISETSGEATYNVNITQVKPLTLGVMDTEDVDTVATITAMQRYLAGEGTLTDAQIKLGDSDNDGKITVTDVTTLQRYFAEMITTIK